MGTDGPRLPGTVDEAREVLSGAEFFRPLSDLPGETDKRRAYVRQLHVVLARMVCRLEHSQLVLTGEASPGAEPGEPDDLAAAEADLAAYGAVRPVAELPDDPEQVEQYIETLHLRLARVGRALAHNQRLREETTPDAGAAVAARTALSVGRPVDDESAGARAAAMDEPDGESRSGAEGPARFLTGEHPEGDADAPGGQPETESGPADTGAGGSPDADEPAEGDENTTAENVAGTTVEPTDDAVDADGAAGATGDSTVDGEADAGHESAQVIPAAADLGQGDATVDVDPAEGGSDAREGITRRQALLGGSIAAALAALAGGAAALLWTGDGDDGDDGDTSAGGEEPGGTDGDGDGPTDGSDDEPTDGSGDAAFELADREVTGDPDGEYVELRYTGEGEQDLSGYSLYDSADGQADPEATGTLDPFVFPDGTVLSTGETVRVYTGEGEAGDGVFYWGYGVNIWREDGDTVVLAEPDGTVVFETEYGPVG